MTNTKQTHNRIQVYGPTDTTNFCLRKLGLDEIRIDYSIGVWTIRESGKTSQQIYEDDERLLKEVIDVNGTSVQITEDYRRIERGDPRARQLRSRCEDIVKQAIGKGANAFNLFGELTENGTNIALSQLE
ncbi:hypothetical protein HYT23_01105 [Candidatus Pacearchaeota archaeon]|nr:hypothetical protein [Candidatus Pacearchaeota archaeon]